MSRLTRYHQESLLTDEGGYYEPTASNYYDIITKLGQIEDILEDHGIKDLTDLDLKLGKLEDIEDELYGVPLEFILTPASKGTKQVYWNESYHDVRNIVPYEEHTCPYVEIFVRINNKVQVKTLWFKDYKKTWWLKEDLSE